jgi:hypothetical protein
MVPSGNSANPDPPKSSVQVLLNNFFAAKNPPPSRKLFCLKPKI